MRELAKTFVVEGSRIDFPRQGGIQTPPRKRLTASSVTRGQVEATTTLTNAVLGSEDQRRTGCRNREASEARFPGGDRHSQLQGQPRLAALRSTPNDAHRPRTPQRLHQPAGFPRWWLPHLGSPQHVQGFRGHRYRRARAAGGLTFGAEKSSRYSFSSSRGSSLRAAALSSSPQSVIRTR